jgi:hypothetical protein
VDFQVTVLKVLVSYPDGVACLDDLKRDTAFLAGCASLVWEKVAESMLIFLEARGLDDWLGGRTVLDCLPVHQAPDVLEKTLLACSVAGTSESSSVSPPPGDLKK